jgi:S-DNA-T family DNA segregation ATPase FtsK/SpoIIIE
VFSRTPRKHIPSPQDEIVIQSPPAAPNPPGTSPFALILPVMGSVLGIAISIIATTSMGNKAVPIYAFVSLPMLLFSVGGGLFNHFSQKKKFRAAVQAREKNYRAYLAGQQRLLSQLAGAQQNANLTPNPAPEACVQLAEERGLRLWEREPHDDDFLFLRLGMGNTEPTFTLKVPEVPPGAFQPDPLLDEAAAIKNIYKTIKDTAIQLPLREAGCAGIIGSKDSLLVTMRSLFIQLCTHHSPDEVKVVLVIPDQEEESWNWARWLPHLWNNDRTVRYYLSTSSAKHTILFSLEELLDQRLFQLSQQNTTGTPKDNSLPRIVFVFADPNIWSGSEKDVFSPLLDLLLNRGSEVGAYSLFLTERRDRIPKECKATVDLTGVNGSSVLMISALGEYIDFQPDTIDGTAADRFARSLASIQLETLSGGDSIPNRASIADLFNLADVSAISIETLWDNSQPETSLAIPIGLRSGGKKAKIDLQDASVGGFGSHALVGGTTGTGKTQFLQTLILLLAANFKPDDLQFVLIDYKGGNLILGLEELPHIVSSLTNIENQGNQTDLIQRLFDSIDVEISRRARILQKFRAGNINEYAHNYASFGSEASPIPHLFVIIDEFAELIQKNPNSDLMKRLISLGQIGRYAGIHLILATQNPGTIVHEDLRNVLNTRICLRMGSREASSQILRRTDAFDNITKDQIGRAYIQVGNNDIFESLQVAWGGAPNIVSGAVVNSHPIRMVALDGSRTLITSQKDPSSVETQMAILARKIVTAAQQRGYQRQPGIWLPLLPTRIERGMLSAGMQEFDGTNWPQATSFSPVIGLFDDPQNKRQGPLAPDLCINHHLLVFGSPGSGKTTLAQSLFVSLVRSHSPNDVNLYIVDFGGRNFSLFETLPQVGAVIQSGENERLRRLLNFIGDEFDRRRSKFEAAKVNGISEHRKLHSDVPPEIFILLENFAGFHDAFVKNQLSTPEFDAFVQIAAEGGSLGIHLIITNGLVAGFPAKISDRVPMAISLEQINPMDYPLIVGRVDRLELAKGIHGRGLIKLPVTGQKPRVLEFQTALPASGETEYERSMELKNLFEQMASAWKDRPKAFSIPPLSRFVNLAEILSNRSYPEAQLEAQPVRSPLGIDLSSPGLAPLAVGLDEGPHFWIAGPAYTGKSSLLQTWLIALADQIPTDHLRFFLIDLADTGLSGLSVLPHCLGVITDKEALKNCSIQAEIERGLGEAVETDPDMDLVIAIDDYGIFRQSVDLNNRTFLMDVGERKHLVKEGMRNVRVHLVLVGAPGDFATSSTNPLVEPVKRGRTGFLVGTNDNSAAYINFGVKLNPNDVGRQVNVGSGFYFFRGQSRPVQFAACVQNGSSLNDWIQRIG